MTWLRKRTFSLEFLCNAILFNVSCIKTNVPHYSLWCNKETVTCMNEEKYLIFYFHKDFNTILIQQIVAEICLPVFCEKTSTARNACHCVWLYYLWHFIWYTSLFNTMCVIYIWLSCTDAWLSTWFFDELYFVCSLYVLFTDWINLVYQHLASVFLGCILIRDSSEKDITEEKMEMLYICRILKGHQLWIAMTLF